MQIYVNKNGQQLGPFEENKVAEMLQTGQLSPNDFGFKQGQSQWQKLETMFPAQPVSNPPSFPVTPPIQPTPSIQPPPTVKSGSSKGLMFGLIGCGSLILLSIIGVIGYFALFGFKKGPFVVSEKPPNSNASPTVQKPPADYTALKNKAEELAKLSPPPKLETNPLIKGKIAIVEKNRDYEARLLGIDYTGKELRQLDLDKFGFSSVRLAATPEEIQTLIQLSCDKGERLGTYEGGIPAFANVCKATVIDYKNSAVIAQKTFTNRTPPEEIKTSKSTAEYVLPEPDELDEFISALPLEKLAVTLAELPFDSQNGTYGKYTGFKNLAGELVRIAFPESLNPNAAIKGKFAVAYKDASGRAELKGFDPFGKEIYKYDYEKWGVGPERLAEKVGEIETLIKIFCQKGDKIGTVKRTAVFANKCDVSIIDYKAGSVIAKQSFENKEMRKDVDTKIYTSQHVVLYPYSEIETYIKGFPK